MKENFDHRLNAIASSGLESKKKAALNLCIAKIEKLQAEIRLLNKTKPLEAEKLLPQLEAMYDEAEAIAANPLVDRVDQLLEHELGIVESEVDLSDYSSLRPPFDAGGRLLFSADLKSDGLECLVNERGQRLLEGVESLDQLIRVGDDVFWRATVTDSSFSPQACQVIYSEKNGQVSPRFAGMDGLADFNGHLVFRFVTALSADKGEPTMQGIYDQRAQKQIGSSFTEVSVPHVAGHKLFFRANDKSSQYLIDQNGKKIYGGFSELDCVMHREIGFGEDQYCIALRHHDSTTHIVDEFGKLQARINGGRIWQFSPHGSGYALHQTDGGLICWLSLRDLKEDKFRSLGEESSDSGGYFLKVSSVIDLEPFRSVAMLGKDLNQHWSCLIEGGGSRRKIPLALDISDVSGAITGPDGRCATIVTSRSYGQPPQRIISLDLRWAQPISDLPGSAGFDSLSCLTNINGQFYYVAKKGTESFVVNEAGQKVSEAYDSIYSIAQKNGLTYIMAKRDNKYILKIIGN